MVHTRFGRLAMGGMLLVMVVVLAACGGGSKKRERAGEPLGERQREAQELKSGHRTLFESDRRPDHTPAIEEVENRAYPRHYVETRRALAGRKAVGRARTRAAARRARTRAAAASWVEAGPFTPTVPARVTYTGRASLDSGRVTAMAIDPNCGRSGQGCRVWVGAAGGGVWRTTNALAAVAHMGAGLRRHGLQRDRLADGRPQRRERQHDLRGHRRAERLG